MGVSEYATRFSGIARLYGIRGLERLRAARVCVFGLGGVGSWAVEALARSGIGHLDLVDMDEVCVSNVNRQLHALDGEIGRAKADVLARRVKAINPECEVRAICEYFLESNAEQMLAPGYDFVMDAIDSISKKALMIALCRRKNISIITSGGAGGRRNPAAVEIKDMAFTSDDGLLRMLRKDLRTHYSFPRDAKLPFGVECVCSVEPLVYPQSDGSICADPEPGSKLRLNCDTGYGTASFVTGAFGFMAASRIVEKLAGQP
ncbi:MAG TPA: tRNA threonylcarbamoyladenosine dehydratase [Verrucomicrobiae bacterium]